MNIANKLTVLRMFLIPVFVLLLIIPDTAATLQAGGAVIPWNQFIAGIIFVFASFTDYLDGYLARKHNLVTAFGEFFDPMADKLLVIAALVMLVEMGDIAGWIVIVIVSRELLVTGLRVLLARSSGKVLAAALPGKIKTFSQMFSIIFYLFDDIGFKAIGIPMAAILMAIAVFFTIYSGAEYFYKGRFVFKDSM